MKNMENKIQLRQKAYGCSYEEARESVEREEARKKEALRPCHCDYIVHVGGCK